MYHVITASANITIDAVEFLTVESGEYKPTVAQDADGFRALTIKHISDTEEEYIETVYVLPEHTLLGGEQVGTVEYVEDEEPEDFTADNFVAMLEEIL